MNFAIIRTALATEYTAVTDEVKAELVKFVDWAEGKQKALADAEALLVAAGYAVTAPPATPAPAAPAA